MRALLCLLLATACVLADDSETRRSKLPYVADAVGNTLPPPSNGPATVGSPVNLLTPDRYEFYTFDESGELVKRLMTLEEIQAIVAAGEETEGLVTFANENQPTIAFNFSQPPYTKVHSVVTNVQNVLKAQMEAHKNKPLTQPTLDTPDVSDSWSLILPSIFGNTGVDIVPDKMSGTFTTPETETIDIDRPIEDNSLSKEGISLIPSSSSTKVNVELKEVSSTVKMPISSTTERLRVTTITTTTTTSTTPKPTPAKPSTTTSTAKPTTTKTSSKPTTIKLRTTTSTTTSTTSRPKTTTTNKPRTTTTSKPTTKDVRTTPKPTTAKPTITTKRVLTTQKESVPNFTKIQTFTNTASSTDKSSVQYEKISTFVPLSTAAYVTERATQKPDRTTKSPETTTKRYLPSSTKAIPSSTKAQPSSTKAQPSSTKAQPSSTKTIPTSTKAPPTTVKAKPSITTYKPSISTLAIVSSTPKDEVEKFNATTITTQSVSPSTTVSSTEYVAIGHHHSTEKSPKPNAENINTVKDNQQEVNFFDVAQSFSQIASDLGGAYQPIPTTSDLLDTTKLNDMNLESKENVEIDIPADVEKPVAVKEATKIENSEMAVKTKPVSNPIKSEKPTVTEKPMEDKNQVDVQKPTKIQQSADIKNSMTQKPTEVQKPTREEKPVKIENPVEEKKPETDDKLTDNFVKISTLEPHQNENKLLTKDSISKTESKTTEASTSKVELTTTTSVVSTTIDPVLSESMDDLFSQIVNQAPQSIFEAQSNANQDLTTKIPKNSAKEDNTQKNETTSEGSDQDNNQGNNVLINKDKILETKIVSNDIPQIINEMKELEKKDKPSELNKIIKHNNTSSDTRLQNMGNKQNLVKIPDPTNKKEEKVESTSPFTTLKQNLHDESTKDNQENKTETVANQEKKPDQNEKTEKEVAKITATTEATPKLEATKKPINTIKKPESTSSNTNKISSSELNKVANIKDNEKIAEEPQPPKIDEFKKKIQKVNIDDKELVNERNSSWKLISTVSPPKINEIPKDKLKTDSQENIDKDIVLDFSKENQGLEVTTKDLGEDIAEFTELCNELAFRYWQTMTESIEKRRSFILSPYSITSMLAMMFMGARGATSGEMNEILKLDDMVTFNPHFTLKNISDSIETAPGSGVIVSAFVRELFSDRSKGRILTFYKERAQHFYNGHVEEINFKLISDIIRRRTNLLVKRYSWGRIVEYMKSNTITMQPPLAAFSANIFQTDCSGSSVEGRDGEMYFVVSPNVRQRRLVPVPAVVYRSGFLAGYDPALDATAAALGNTNSIISTLFLMPGQQGNVVHAEDLEALEKRLLDSNPTTPAWNRLLRTLLPRMGLELQIPRFSHKSIFNVSTTLQKMGLKELFDPEHADLGGLNGPSKDLYLSDMVQSTTFVTCGEGVIGEQHHIEEYPESLNGSQRRRTSRWVNGWDEPRDYQRAFHDPHDVGEAMNLPLHLRPRQARLPSRNAQPARLKFDRPFLYFVRHNPSGMILYVGRYNPRLLP